MSAESLFSRLDRGGWGELACWVGVQDEGVHLDFKAKQDATTPEPSGNDKEVLSRAISGFANTEGGVLVIGAKTDKTAGIERLSCLVPIADIERFNERVRAFLPELTEPPLAGVRTVSLPDPASPDRGVLAIFVPASDGGPHRARFGHAKDRYMMRSDDKTSVMPHALLADRFGRVARSRLRLRVVWEGQFHSSAASIKFSLRNDGRGTARQPAIEIELTPGLAPLQWELARSYGIEVPWQRLISRLGERSAMLFQSSSDVVIYPGVEVAVGYAKGPMTPPPLMNPIDVRGRLHATDAQPIEFRCTLSPGLGHDEMLP